MNIFSPNQVCNWLKWPLEVLEYRLWPPVEYTLCFCWFTKMREIQIIDVGYWKFKLFFADPVLVCVSPKAQVKRGGSHAVLGSSKKSSSLNGQAIKRCPPPPRLMGGNFFYNVPTFQRPLSSRGGGLFS